jgi:protocatechuate 3,4-dioxygenase beta subunit
MRPFALIVVLVLAALALLGGLFLIGREDRSPDAGAAAIATDGSTRGAPAGAESLGASPPVLEAAGGGGGGDGRAAPVSHSKPAPRAPTVASEIPGVVVRGRVLGNLGKPIEGATVLAAESSGSVGLLLDEIDADRMDWFQRAETKTDRDGRFEIRPSARSKVAVAVRAPGFAPLDREFALSGSERDVGDLALETSVVLSGRVVDTSGRPIEGAKIARRSPTTESFAPFARARGALVAQTDAQGAFRVDQLASGPWKLLVTHDRYPDLVEQGETDRPGTVRSGLVLTMENGQTIAGKLVGAPADGIAKLTIRATLAPAAEGSSQEASPLGFRSFAPSSVREARCSADGSFELAGLLPGRTYRLTARDDDRARFFGRSRSAPTTARAGDRNVQLTYRPETALVFQAVDAISNTPIEELSVRAGYGFSMPLLDENGQAVKRFPEGRVRFGDLPGRPGGPVGSGSATGLKLTVESPGYRALERENVALLEGQDTDLGVLRLERAPVVKVLVLDAASGMPVADATVSIGEVERPTLGRAHDMRFTVSTDSSDDDDAFLPGAAQRARTDRDGRASVTSLPGRTVRLRVRDGEHSPHESEPMALPLTEDVEVTVRLGRGGKVLVEVVGPKGDPISGVEVDHRAPNARGGELVFSSEDGRTDADGLLVFEHLTPGDHEFRLRPAQSSGFVSLGGGGGARMRSVSRISGIGDAEEGWSTVTVTEGGAETLRLEAPARGSLAGRVTEGGQPLANAQLRLVRSGSNAMAMPFGNEGREARTDGRGEYLIDGVEVGEYDLDVRHASRAMASERSARVREGENRLDVDLSVAIVEGRVLGTDGKPLAGVRVRAERATAGWEGGRRGFSFAVMITDDGNDEPQVAMGPEGGGSPSTTDAEGRYALRGVLPDVELVVNATGKEVQPGRSEPFRVASDEVKRNVDLKLEDGGAIEVTVRRQGEGPPGRYLARATPEGGGEPKVQMIGPGGSSRISGLKPGRWHVVLDPLMGPIEGGGEGEKLEQDVEVVVGQSAKANFDAP